MFLLLILQKICAGYKDFKVVLWGLMGGCQNKLPHVQFILQVNLKFSSGYGQLILTDTHKPQKNKPLIFSYILIRFYKNSTSHNITKVLLCEKTDMAKDTS